MNEPTIRVRIRFAKTDDTDSILQIYAWYIENTAFSFEFSVPSWVDYQRRIQKYSKEAPWLVAESGGTIIGFAYASPHRGRAAYQWNREVSVYIVEEFQGKGVAKYLYETLFDLLKRQGYTNALAGIVSPNPKSEKFHKKMGFHLVGVYHNIGFKFEQWWNVGWYELFLQEKAHHPVAILPIAQIVSAIDFEKVLKLSNKKG